MIALKELGILIRKLGVPEADGTYAREFVRLAKEAAAQEDAIDAARGKVFSALGGFLQSIDDEKVTYSPARLKELRDSLSGFEDVVFAQVRSPRCNKPGCAVIHADQPAPKPTEGPKECGFCAGTRRVDDGAGNDSWPCPKCATTERR